MYKLEPQGGSMSDQLKDILFREHTTTESDRRLEEVRDYLFRRQEAYKTRMDILMRNFDTGGIYWYDPLGGIFND